MRNRNFVFLSIFLILSIMFSITIPVCATDNNTGIQPCASDYISSVWASASGGNGSITVDYSITATNTMTSLGATMIEIKNSSGTTVKLFQYPETPTLMATNRIYYRHSETWYGASSGSKYYAIVYFKAANSSGNDTTMYTTSYAYAG